jgi:hypothetical protein
MCSANDAPEHQFMLDSPCIGKFRQTLIYFSDLAPRMPAGGVFAVARGSLSGDIQYPDVNSSSLIAADSSRQSVSFHINGIHTKLRQEAIVGQLRALAIGKNPAG